VADGLKDGLVDDPNEYISVFFASNSKIAAKKGLNRLIDDHAARLAS
jgi:hypothetical protein